MAESKFINPLFQRTEGGQPPARLRGPQATAPANEVPAPHGQAPVKFTFYFMPDQLERLDNIWVRAKVDHRERLNKSEFVRLALERLMEEFDRDPQSVIAELRRQRAG